jgi:hypothetical protein
MRLGTDRRRALPETPRSGNHALYNMGRSAMVVTSELLFQKRAGVGINARRNRNAYTLNHRRLFRLRFPHRGVRIFLRLGRFFNRRRHRLGGRAKPLLRGQQCFYLTRRVHICQMPKSQEWQPSASTIRISSSTPDRSGTGLQRRRTASAGSVEGIKAVTFRFLLCFSESSQRSIYTAVGRIDTWRKGAN